jgi:cobalamin biosynthesis Mg chelatase CobN
MLNFNEGLDDYSGSQVDGFDELLGKRRKRKTAERAAITAKVDKANATALAVQHSETKAIEKEAEIAKSEEVKKVAEEETKRVVETANIAKDQVLEEKADASKKKIIIIVVVAVLLIVAGGGYFLLKK